MATKTFNNYRLRRTLPKLSGNMQLDLIVGLRPDGDNLYVNQAHLRPIGSETYTPIVDERLMDTTHQLNIKKFYENTKSNFFEHPCDPTLSSDWPRMVSWSEMDRMKYIKRWDDVCWAGAKRGHNKLYGCTHEIFVPLWLEQCDGIRFYINIYKAQSGLVEEDINPAAKFMLDLSPVYLYSRWNTRDTVISGQAQTISQSKYYKPAAKFNNDFVTYFVDYLNYIGIADGNTDVMSIDFENNITAISGLQVSSGNVVTQQNYNIARNLLYRERPLLENNSLLTNSFMDNGLITKQLINFNLCFDLRELLDSIHGATSFTSSNQYRIGVDVKVLRKYRDLNLDKMIEPDWTKSNSGTDPYTDRECGYVWQDVEARDFYTNHHYIPRPKANYEYTEGVDGTYEVSESPLNALNYKNDHYCTDIIHANKISQPICHWVKVDDPDGDLFNLYDGFGAYTIKDGELIEYSHGFGQTPDLSDAEYDEIADNTAWLGAKLKGTGADIQNILNAPLSKVESGFFSDASNFINGLKFTYDPSTTSYNTSANRSAPSKVYIGVMTTPKNCNLESLWNKQSTQINEHSVVNILMDRRDSNENLPTWGTLPQYQSDEATAHDIAYDWHLYSDGDNRYACRKVVNGTTYYLYYDPTGTLTIPGYYVWLNPKVKGDPIVPVPKEARRTDDTIRRSMLMRLGGLDEPNFSQRNHDNTNSLYIAYRRYPASEDRKPTASDPLYVIFFQAESEADDATKSLVYQDLRPHGLTPSRLIEGLQSYWNKYKQAYDIIQEVKNDPGVEVDPTILPDMDDLDVIVQVMSNIEAPAVIYFDRTIRSQQDITLSSKAHEITYVKDTEANAYVWRYSAAIRPAICSYTKTRNEDDLYFNTKPNAWGRNFLWIKNPIFPIGQTFPSNLTPYISTGITPKYPSLNFEVIETINTDISGLKNPQGDLLYDEVPPIYKGYTSTGRDLYSYNYNDFVSSSEFGAHKNLSWSMIDGLSNWDGSMDFGDKWKIFDAALKTMIINHQYDASMYRTQGEEIDYWLYKTDYDTFRWPEYKWFDKSIITDLPNENTYIIKSVTNTKDALEEIALKMMCGTDDREDYIAGTDSGVLNQSAIKYDYAYLRSCYDFEYNLIKIEPQMTGAKISTDQHTEQVLFKYIYEIHTVLK